MKYRRIASAIVLLLAGCSSYDAEKVAARFTEVEGIVEIGMSFQDAKAKLEDAGFRVGESYAPTENKDYFVTHIPLTEDMPKRAIIAESLGRGSDQRRYATLRMNEDMVITTIE